MTGVGFGYASMLSLLKAMRPVPANSSKPTTTIGRRLRQNAMRDLNMGSSSNEMKAALELVAWWRLQHVAKKHGVVGYDQFSALQTIENLNPVVVSQADLNDSLYKMVAIGCHPSRHRAIGFADHAIRGYGDGFHRVVDANDEVSEHSGAQFIVGVRDLGTDRYSMSVRINRRVDLRDLTVKHAAGIGHHFDLNRLAQVKK